MSECVICHNDEAPLQEYDLEDGLTVEVCSDECASRYLHEMRERWLDAQADSLHDAMQEDAIG